MWGVPDKPPGELRIATCKGCILIRSSVSWRLEKFYPPTDETVAFSGEFIGYGSDADHGQKSAEDWTFVVIAANAKNAGLVGREFYLCSRVGSGDTKDVVSGELQSAW